MDYWGAKGYVGPPPLKLLGGPGPPWPPLFLRLWIESVFSAEFIFLDKNVDFEQTDFTTDIIFMNYKYSSIKGHH